MADISHPEVAPPGIKEDAFFTGAERHRHSGINFGDSPREHGSVPFEYFTQPVVGRSSLGWRKMIEAGEEGVTIGVIDRQNVLAWARDNQRVPLTHGDIIASVGKEDRHQTRITIMPTRNMGIPSIKILNLQSGGIEAIRPVIEYFKRSYGDLADKIEIEYDGIEPDDSDLNARRH